MIERGKRDGELRPLDNFHIAISPVTLVVFYFSPAPVLRAVGEIDPYSEANVEGRRAEALRFVRYALFTDPESEKP